MKPEMLELVLQEILQEQKETNLINGQLAGYIKTLSDKIESLEEMIEKSGKSEEINQAKSSQKIQDGLAEIKSAISAKTGQITHKRFFQLFPSMNIREYYQIYGNIFKWLSLFGVMCLIIRLIRDLLQKQGFL